MSPQPPALRVGEFRVTEFVGAGGMGVVYRAVHVGNGKNVAVKFLNTRAAKSRERFAHEARVQASLKHPRLVAFYEWHEINGVPCIVMEWVDGVTLSQMIRGGGALEWEKAATIFAQIVEAIGWMHERGVIHRDIKSGNVKINARGEVKLLDFGIAVTDNAPKLTATGAFVGTLHYLSPEQARGVKADERCDIWALGVLFYEMLGGQVPFDAPTMGELLEKVARAHYAPLRTLRPQTPRRAEVIVRRCLKKSPAARYQNTAQLAGDVARLRNANKATTERAVLAPDSKVWWGAGVATFVVVMSLGWSQMRTPQPPQPIEAQTTATPPESSGNEAATALIPAKLPTIAPVPLRSSDDGSSTVTIDMVEGASQTQIWRDGKLLGKPPLPIRARPGEKLDLEFRREGYRTMRRSITAGNVAQQYSYNLEREES